MNLNVGLLDVNVQPPPNNPLSKFHHLSSPNIPNYVQLQYVIRQYKKVRFAHLRERERESSAPNITKLTNAMNSKVTYCMNVVFCFPLPDFGNDCLNLVNN